MFKLLDGRGKQAAWWWRKASCLMVEESKLLDSGGKQPAWWWRKASCLTVEESKLLDGGGKQAAWWWRKVLICCIYSTHAWNKNIHCWCCIISHCASLLSTAYHSSSVFSLKHSAISASLSCWIALPSIVFSSAVLRISKNSNSCRRKRNRLHDELFPILPTWPN